MAIVRRVLDLSHHNTVTSIPAIKEAGIWGIIHKATEATAYRDPNYPTRKAMFLDAGLLWGAYHFLHPGSITTQVDFFLRTAGVDDTTLYALDWEAASTGTAGEAQAVDFLSQLEAKTGRKGVVYSGNVAKEQIHGINDYLGAHRLWLAQYSSTPSTQESWHNQVWLWQYSDGRAGPTPHGCPGVTGEVDTNSWTDSQDALISQWAGTAVIPPPVEMPTVTITVKSSVPVRLVVVQE